MKAKRQPYLDTTDGLWKIPLTKGYVCIVDECDCVSLAMHNWTVAITRGGIPYAYRKRPSTRRQMYMHRFIMGVLDCPVQIDHINGNSLDNRRSNLRECTQRQNSYNRRNSKLGKTGRKGVVFDARRNRYRARVRVNGKEVHLGRFLTCWEAAEAYDLAAERLHGEFSSTNTKLAIH